MNIPMLLNSLCMIKLQMTITPPDDNNMLYEAEYDLRCKIAELTCPVILGHEFMYNGIQYAVETVSPLFYPNNGVECLWAYTAKATELYRADAAHDELYLYRAMTLNGERFEIIAGELEHVNNFCQ